MDHKTAIEEMVKDTSIINVLEDLSLVARKQNRTNLADKLLALSLDLPGETPVPNPTEEDTEPVKVRVTAPDGTPINAIVEPLYASAHLATDSFTLKPDGTLDFDYAGESDIDWNTQVPYVENGHRIFVDEERREWREQDLVVLVELPLNEWRDAVSANLRQSGHPALADAFAALSDDDTQGWRDDHTTPEDTAEAYAQEGESE